MPFGRVRSADGDRDGHVQGRLCSSVHVQRDGADRPEGTDVVGHAALAEREVDSAGERRGPGREDVGLAERGEPGVPAPRVGRERGDLRAAGVRPLPWGAGGEGEIDATVGGGDPGGGARGRSRRRVRAGRRRSRRAVCPSGTGRRGRPSGCGRCDRPGRPRRCRLLLWSCARFLPRMCAVLTSKVGRNVSSANKAGRAYLLGCPRLRRASERALEWRKRWTTSAECRTW